MAELLQEMGALLTGGKSLLASAASLAITNLFTSWKSRQLTTEMKERDEKREEKREEQRHDWDLDKEQRQQERFAYPIKEGPGWLRGNVRGLFSDLSQAPPVVLISPALDAGNRGFWAYARDTAADFLAPYAAGRLLYFQPGKPDQYVSWPHTHLYENDLKDLPAFVVFPVVLAEDALSIYIGGCHLLPRHLDGTEDQKWLPPMHVLTIKRLGKGDRKEVKIVLEGYAGIQANPARVNHGVQLDEKDADRASVLLAAKTISLLVVKMMDNYYLLRRPQYPEAFDKALADLDITETEHHLAELELDRMVDPSMHLLYRAGRHTRKKDWDAASQSLVQAFRQLPALPTDQPMTNAEDVGRALDALPAFPLVDVPYLSKAKEVLASFPADASVKVRLAGSLDDCLKRTKGELAMNDPANKELEEQAAKLKAELERVKKRNLVFLLTGRTGTGKSSTINSLMNEPVCPVGDDEPETSEVLGYEMELGGIPVQVVDTPGLCDNLPVIGNDELYLNMMRDYFKKLDKRIDSLWFVTRLIETRVGPDEMRGIELISKAFGTEGWEHAVIVFTWANSVMPPSDYQRKLQKRTELVRVEIAKHVGAEVANSIPAVAVEKFSATTPDGATWLNKLYVSVLKRIRKDALEGFYMATVNLITPQEGKPTHIPLTESDKKVVGEVVRGTKLGAVLGAIGGLAVAGAAGASAGAAAAATLVAAGIGAGVGALYKGWKWLTGG